MVYFQRRELEKAAAMWRAVLEIDPHFATTRENLLILEPSGVARNGVIVDRCRNLNTAFFLVSGIHPPLFQPPTHFSPVRDEILRQLGVKIPSIKL